MLQQRKHHKRVADPLDKPFNPHEFGSVITWLTLDYGLTVSGTDVVSWESSTGDVLVPSGTGSPQYDGTQISFDGNHMLICASPIDTANAKGSVSCTIICDTTTTTAGYFFSHPASAIADGISWSFPNFADRIRWRVVGNISGAAADTTFDSNDGVTRMLHGQWKNSGTLRQYIWSDGLLLGELAGAAGDSIFNTAPTEIIVGGRNSTDTQYGIFNIREVVVLEDFLDFEARTLYFRRLSRKHGLDLFGVS